MSYKFSEKQMNVWKETVGNENGGKPLHRWNVSTGAVRSGKTFLDFWRIPYRTRNAPRDGLVVLLGHTRGTLERNILSPMREIWGKDFVGHINAENKVSLFGRDCFAIGAEKANQVEKLQGTGVSYCYGDEITTWSEPVFQMLKSRLDKAGACFDGTCNPEGPKHWLKKFLDSGADICECTFAIDDNPFLEKTFIDNIKQEYSGTVYYDRYILGKWVAAEGLIYRAFAENKSGFADSGRHDYAKVLVGVDWGDSASRHAFVCVGVTNGFARLVALASESHNAEGLTPGDVEERLCAFVERMERTYGRVDCVYCDHLNTLINGCRVAFRKNGTNVCITKANKVPINERIFATCRLMAAGRFGISEECRTLAEAFETAAWNPAKPDCRLDDGSLDVDTLDAFEYAWSNYVYLFVR